MVLSGSLLFYAAPVDRFGNLFFRAKMGLLLLAAANVYIFRATAYRSIGGWDRDSVPPRGAKVAGAVALTLWAATITTGRMIPYQQYWFR